MAASGGPPATMSDCVFTNNVMNGQSLGGGGAYINRTMIVTNCDFIGNTAVSEFADGGGVFADGGTIDMISCNFVDNTATRRGGGMRQDTLVTYVGCVFADNEAGDEGGALYVDAPSQMGNMVFTGNVAASLGGAVFIQGESLAAWNCTFEGNVAGESGGGVASQGSGAISELDNCILWENSDSSGQTLTAQVFDSFNSMTSLNYSCVQGLSEESGGAGNIGADPAFVDADNGDLRLSSGSPSIDAGLNSAVPDEIANDIDGNPRFVDDPNTPDCPQAPGTCGEPPIVDMGAYEFHGLTCEWDLDGDGNVGITDLLLLLGDFGSCDGSPADFDGDGCVTIVDFLTLLHNFGPCPDGSCPWDVNGDSVVDHTDLFQVLGNLGPCDGCPEDVNGDGVVNGQDVLAVVAHFGPCP